MNYLVNSILIPNMLLITKEDIQQYGQFDFERALLQIQRAVKLIVKEIDLYFKDTEVRQAYEDYIDTNKTLLSNMQNKVPPTYPFRAITLSQEILCQCCTRSNQDLAEDVFIESPTGLIINSACVDSMLQQVVGKDLFIEYQALVLKAITNFMDKIVFKPNFSGNLENFIKNQLSNKDDLSELRRVHHQLNNIFSN